MATLFSSDFFTRLALGLLVNFEISIVALVLGLVSGGALALIYTTLSLPPLRWLISGFISILRATPVFIAMFFLAGLLRPHYASIGQYIDDPKKFFVVIACLPYIASYSFDQVGEAVSQLKNGTARAALLLIPNMARSFQVLVATSCFGSAIGVNEGMSAVLSEAELLGESPSRYVLFAGTVVIFYLLMQTVVASSRWLHKAISHRVL